METKQPVLESTIDYVKIGLHGKLELVCAHKYGYYEQVMTQLTCSEEKVATLLPFDNRALEIHQISTDYKYLLCNILHR